MIRPIPMYAPELNGPSPGMLEARDASPPPAGSFSSLLNREAENRKTNKLDGLVSKHPRRVRKEYVNPNV